MRKRKCTKKPETELLQALADNSIETAFLAGVLWARENPEWIALEEYPSKNDPPRSENILVVYPRGVVINAFKGRTGHGLNPVWERFVEMGGDPTHWMSIPKGPK